jgi:hypothetical protein
MIIYFIQVMMILISFLFSNKIKAKNNQSMQFIVKLSTQKITYLYLRNIVHYKLIVKE